MTRRLLLCILVLHGVSACAPGPPRFGGSRPSIAEDLVFETVTRWIHRAYRPSELNGIPVAWCLAAGRRAFTAEDRYRRGEEERWVPSQRLLDQMNDLTPPVVSISECWQSDETQEEYGRGGPAAVVLMIDQPDWTSPLTARVTMRTRENNSFRFQYVCRVEERGGTWRVLECV